MTFTHTVPDLLCLIVVQHASVRLPIGKGAPRAVDICFVKPTSISLAVPQQRSASIRIVGWKYLVNRNCEEEQDGKDDW